MSDPFFTVFTPTFNRAHLLDRPFRSLVAQTFRDFEWVVVDDGSTDGTEKLVRGWIGQTGFPIRYFRQRHGHKKAAFNRGVAMAQGELFICLDSDDELTPTALELFRRYWLAIPAADRSGFLGLRGGTVKPDGSRTGNTFSADVIDGSWLDIYHKERWKGEILACERVDLLRSNPFPEAVSGHVPEGVVQHPLAARYKMRMFNDVVRIYHDSPDALSAARTPLVTGVQGMALWSAQTLRREFGYFRYHPRRFIVAAANYTRFHLHLWSQGTRKRYRLGGLRQAALVTALAPIGLALFFRDLSRALVVSAGAQ